MNKKTMGCFASTQSGGTTANNDDKLPLGVSVHYLSTTFLDEVRNRENLDEKSKIYELERIPYNNDDDDQLGVIRSKGRNTVCPRDSQLGAAYVDCLNGEDNVGPSTFMLSYCWHYTIGDIVKTLIEYCASQKLNPKRTYIWICCLCNNQHRIAEMNKSGILVPFEEFSSIFYSRVTTIRRILAMMTPWEEPFYLKRVWCIFELYTAITNEQCKVTVVMPPAEKDRLVDSLRLDDGLQTLFTSFSQTNVENAQASSTDDKEKILTLIQNDSGYNALNFYLPVVDECVLILILKKSTDIYFSLFDVGPHLYYCGIPRRWSMNFAKNRLEAKS